MRRYLLFASQLYSLSILRPLQEAIRKRDGDAAWFLQTGETEYLRPGERLLRSTPEVKAYGPDAVLVPGNWVPPFFPGIKVEVFHGFSVNKRSLDRGHFRIRGFFDLYCTQGPDTTPRFEALAREHGHFRVRETGWPKVDPLFRDEPPPFPAGDGRPVVLYASTFTPRLTSTTHLFEEVKRMSRSGRWQWLVTFHPKMPREIVERYRALEGPNLEFVETDDIIPLYKAADALLCDTSSAISEFLLQHKPVVTFRNRKPEPHMIDVADPGEVESALERALARPPEVMEEIRRYADHIHPYQDGRSSERVLDAVEESLALGRDGLRRKPLNLWRRWQARRRLGYFGI